MKLRTRLVLALVVVSVPLVAGGRGLRADIERRAVVASLAQSARARMETGGREQCEASPETFQDPPSWPGREPRRPEARGIGPRAGAGAGGPRESPGPIEDPPSRPPAELPPRAPPRSPRLEMFAYGPDFASANPNAPSIPPVLQRAVEAGAREAGTVRDEADRREVTALVRMNWSSGPCAVVLAMRRDEKPASRPLHELGYAVCIVGGLALAILLAVGPVERRVRRLADEVRRSAADQYRADVPAEGGDEIAELGGAFNAAAAEVRAHIAELQRRERALRDFVENTTHDVMLPLTVLQGHLSKLRDAVEAGKAVDRGTVREALEELQYLASLLQNLAAAAKLEAGEPKIQRHPFSWNPLVERVVLRHATIAREKGVELDFAVPEGEVLARGDVTLVEQALSNVVHNAVRYNHTGGHVAVVLAVEGGRFAVRVLDDGPGVEDAELERIAERSYRSDAARVRHPAGTGLGLSIAQDVADRHDFELEIRRVEPCGLAVELRGPVIDAPRPET